MFYGQVRRKYFTATENTVSTITGNDVIGTSSELEISNAMSAPTGKTISANLVGTSSNVNYLSGLKIQIDRDGATDKTQQARLPYRLFLPKEKEIF